MQQHVRGISGAREAAGHFAARVLFWDDLRLRLATFPDLVRAHYPQLFGSVCARPLAVSDAHALVSRFEELIPEERERERVALRTLIRNEASAVRLNATTMIEAGCTSSALAAQKPTALRISWSS
jgi:hypothetical protein